ncbi:MAG: hypothetical protein AWU57_5038 [Marinobacter sp. T13-3]|nr:MAG: hypothetical protein AWU57_5038 [Marinobacter sp. T13-3]
MKTDHPVGTRQQGGALANVIVALFFGALLTVAIKIGPVYIDDLTIQEALESLEGTEGLSSMGPAPDQQTAKREQRQWLRCQEHFRGKKWRICSYFGRLRSAQQSFWQRGQYRSLPA